MKLLPTLACMVWALVGNLTAQTLVPESYNMGENSLGVPKYFPAKLTNISEKPLRILGVMCTGYADLDIKFLRVSDSTKYEAFMLPDETVDLLVQMISRARAPMTLGCSMEFEDTNGVRSFGAGLGVGGSMSKEAIITSVAPTVEFGNLSPSTGSSAIITLKNTGSGDAHYRAINKPSAPFSIADDKIWFVKAADSVLVTVAFEPEAPGDYVDTIEFGHAYIYTPSPVRVMLRGSSGAALPSLVALTPTVNVTDVQTGAESTVAIAFVASSSGAQVLSASLRDGVAFSIASIAPLPASISPGDTLVIGVLFRPSSAGTFSDVLTLTMAEGPITQVDLNGTAVVSGVTEVASLCIVHPNPAVGTVYWCGESQDVWLVINTVGSVVATVQSDDQGRCAWTANGSGTYALRNVRRGEMLRVLVLK